MDRRKFINALGMVAAAIALQPEALTFTKTLPRKFGSFDVAEDGTLSLGGQTKFPLYGPAGVLTMQAVTYRLIDGDKGIVEQKEIA